MTCECGCGYEGEDEVAQFLIEEALLERLELEEQAAELAGAAEAEKQAPVERSLARARQLFGGDD